MTIGKNNFMELLLKDFQIRSFQPTQGGSSFPFVSSFHPTFCDSVYDYFVILYYKSSAFVILIRLIIKVCFFCLHSCLFELIYYIEFFNIITCCFFALFF